MPFLQTIDLTIRLKGGILLAMRSKETLGKRKKSSGRKINPDIPDLFSLPEVPLTAAFMRRAVAAYLAEQCPAGLAFRVPARISRYQADVAAFWVEFSGRGKNQLAKVERTVAVDIFTDREECLPECAEAAELAKELRALRLLRFEMERQIREKEPWLAVDGELFPEFRTFDYSATGNREYIKLMRKHSRLQHALFKGSRLELVRSAGVADYLYIAVPAGEVMPEDIADGWGLLHIFSDGRVKVARVASRQQCSGDSRMHLALNIASRSMESVLFREGIEIKGEEVKFFRPPRKRNKLLIGG